MQKKIWAYLQLMRPANIITAIADILLGVSLAFAVAESGFFDTPTAPEDWTNLILLIIATSGLYGGGVVFNDYFDAALDAKERPERPIPRGDASLKGASLLGAFLLAAGITAAFGVNATSGYIAIAIALAVLVYDSKAKHSAVFGPVVMGMCRGGNLLLGMSVIPVVITGYWFLALIPLIYIQGITLISRGEVKTAGKSVLYAGVACYCIVVILILALTFLEAFYLWQTLPFFLLFAVMVLPPAFRAVLSEDPMMARKAVKAGVVSMIIFDAALAAGFAGWMVGIMILVLLPVSRWMGRYFAVT